MTPKDNLFLVGWLFCDVSAIAINPCPTCQAVESLHRLVVLFIFILYQLSFQQISFKLKHHGVF